MNVVVKTLKYALLLALLVVVVLLLLLRFNPQSLLAVANSVQSAAQVQADSIAVQFWHPGLELVGVTADTPAAKVELSEVQAAADLSSWWNTQPFWDIKVGQANVHMMPAEVAEGEAATGGLALPQFVQYLTFSSVTIDRLTVTGANELDASFSAQQDGQDIDLSGELSLGTQQISLNGELERDPAARALGFDVQLSIASADESENQPGLALQGTLAGRLQHAAALIVEFSNGQIDIANQAGGYKVDGIGGGFSLAGDEDSTDVQLQEFTAGVTAPGWSGPLAVQLNGSLGFAANGNVADLVAQLGATELALKGRLAGDFSSGKGDIKVASQQLHESVPIAPYRAEDLYPLNVAAGFDYTTSGVSLTDIAIESPANALLGELALASEPLSLTGRLHAARLYVPLVAVENTVEADGAEVEAKAEVEAETETEAQPGVETAAKTDTETATEANTETEAAVAAASESDRLFGSAPLPWQTLADATVDFELLADQLKLQEAEFTDFKVTVDASDGKLAVTPFSASLGGGSFEGILKLTVNEAVDAADANFDFQLDGIALESFGFVPQEELAGGKLRIDVDLKTRGTSAADFAGALNGDILLMVQEAQLMNDFIELAGSDLIMEILNKVNPFQKEDPTTELSCGLVKFEAVDGVLTTNDELVMETSKMEIVGNGEIDLGKETLGITLSPNAKSGLGINVGSLVKFLKVGGTLKEPRPAVSAGGLLKSGLAIGAVMATGGASLAAEGLAKRAINAGSKCAGIASARPAGGNEAPPPG